MRPIENKYLIDNETSRHTSERRWLFPFILLILSVSFHVFADPGFINKVYIRTNTGLVTASVDKSDAANNETVTLTVTDIPNGYEVIVTASKAIGSDEGKLNLSNGVSSVPGTTVFTFTMPDYTVYIDIQVEPEKSSSLQEYSITVETLGVLPGQTSFTIEGDGIKGDALSGYRIEAGKTVTVTLTILSTAMLKLTKTEAFAPDGSWRWVDLSGNGGVMNLTFTMPSAAVVVRFTLTGIVLPTPPDPSDDDDPSVICYTVVLPCLEGACTVPSAGSYTVENGGDFSFHLVLDPGYNQSIPVVVVNERDTLKSADDNIPDRFSYKISRVSDDLVIHVGNIRKNSETANDPVTTGGLRVVTSGTTVGLVSDSACEAFVYTFGGQQVGHLCLDAGSLRQLTLSHGLYIVRSGSQTIKLNLCK